MRYIVLALSNDRDKFVSKYLLRCIEGKWYDIVLYLYDRVVDMFNGLYYGRLRGPIISLGILNIDAFNSRIDLSSGDKLCRSMDNTVWDIIRHIKGCDGCLYDRMFYIDYITQGEYISIDIMYKIGRDVFVELEYESDYPRIDYRRCKIKFSYHKSVSYYEIYYRHMEELFGTTKFTDMIKGRSLRELDDELYRYVVEKDLLVNEYTT